MRTITESAARIRGTGEKRDYMQVACLICSIYLTIGYSVGMKPLDVTGSLSVRKPEWRHLLAGSQRNDCQRFATVQISRQGLGHRLGEVIFGILFAFEAHAEFVLSKEAFGVSGRHGEYTWVQSFLDFDSLRSTSTIKRAKHLKVVRLNSWDDLVLYDRECHVFLITGYKSCTELVSPFRRNVNCFEHKMGAYNMAKSYLRRLLKENGLSTTVASHFTNESKISVAWHVRVGDFTLFRSVEFYRKVHLLIQDLFGSRYQNYFLSEGHCKQVERLLPFKAMSLCNMSGPDTFRHFLSANVFITSGSSFAAIAALLRTNHIVFQTLPKEGRFGVYEVTDHAVVNSSGDLLHPPVEVLKRQASGILEELTKK